MTNLSVPVKITHTMRTFKNVREEYERRGYKFSVLPHIKGFIFQASIVNEFGDTINYDCVGKTQLKVYDQAARFLLRVERLLAEYGLDF